MPSGLRARSIIYNFPFFEREGVDYDPEKREHVVTTFLSHLPYVRGAWIDQDKLRDPLFIEVNPQHARLQDKTMGEIEDGLGKVLKRFYNYQQCL